MKKEITAEYMHKLLKDGAFKNVDLSRLATMSDDERRVFTIEQADRLLGAQGYGDTMRWYMGQFFDDEFELRDDNPLCEEDSVLAQWYIALADLGWCLITHLPQLGQHHIQEGPCHVHS